MIVRNHWIKKHKMKFILNLTLLFFFLDSSAQNQGNIWYFGNHAGVDFSSGSPVAIHGGQTFNSSSYSEGTSVLSDESGNLLMYSNGQTLWNKNHQIMLNGDGLFGNFSSTQSSIIIPKPNSQKLYYVFTVDDLWESGSDYGLRYSVVDMCKENGEGMILPNQKNVLLLDGAYEKVGAVRHFNGIDYWVTAHKLHTNEYYSYLLDQNGISDTVISIVGPTSTNGQGQLKFSPDGQRMAVAHNQHHLAGIEFILFDFDNTTGALSNPIILENNGYNVYGIEFSPNSSVLYSVFTRLSPLELRIMQFDISSGDQTMINNSLLSVYQMNSVSLRGLQIAPDNKIYMVSMPNGYLLSINNPNNLGSSCNVQNNAVFLGGNMGDKTLPTFVAGFSYGNLNFSDCKLSVEDLNSNQGNKTLVKIIDLLGRETPEKPNTMMIYIYSDSSTEKVFRVE